MSAGINPAPHPPLARTTALFAVMTGCDGSAPGRMPMGSSDRLRTECIITHAHINCPGARKIYIREHNFKPMFGTRIKELHFIPSRV